MGLSYSSSTGEYEFTGKYLDESYTTIPNDADYYQVVGSNTPSYAYNNYHLIEAVTCDNRLTYKGSETNNSSLFQVGDVFSPTNQSKFFKNSSFHDGSKVNYKIEVISMDENGCTLNISNF